MGGSYGEASSEVVQALLDIAGLRGDLNIHGGLRDRWGLFVAEFDDYYGYETKSNEETDHVRRRWSRCTVHDGWGDIERFTPQECPEGARRYFRVEGASYALVEHEWHAVGSYVPERLFIYPYSPKFSIRRVVGELAEYRRLHPAKIFLLPTTDPAKVKKKKR